MIPAEAAGLFCTHPDLLTQVVASASAAAVLVTPQTDPGRTPGAAGDGHHCLEPES